MGVANYTNGSYSAEVEMELTVNGRIYSIGQLGPTFLILDDPADHPPAQAEIMVAIDGHVKRWPVQLPDGVRAGQAHTRIECCTPVSGNAAR